MKKIGIEDLFKEVDIFKKLRESAEQSIQKLDQMHQSSVKVAQALNDALGKNKMDSSKSINELNKAQEKSNKLLIEAIKIENLKKQAEANQVKVTQQLEKLEQEYQKRLREGGKALQENEKAEQQKLKTQRERIKLSEQQQRAEERKQKAEERASQQAQKEASAYNQLVKATRDLKNASKDLASEMNKLEEEGKQNTAQYQRLANQYKIVTAEAQKYDARLKQIDANVGDNFRNVGNYVGALQTLQNGLANVGLAFGIGAVVTKATNTLKSFDEENANMSKTLDVSTKEAKALSQELLKIDTRTSVQELQRIAVIGGQLGIGKKDIVGFTDSVNKLNVALGDEFTGGADEITSVIGGLRNVFSDIKSQNVSQDLLNIGNALNELGAQGSATSPVISDFAGRIGGVGIPLGLSTGQVLGLSATLQELNVTAERGGTAVSGILKKMAEDTEGFSKIAGMNTQEFANLVNTDLMGAFMKVVEGTKQFKGDAVGLATALDGLKLDGAGASEVLLKLSTNTDLLTKRTNLATESLKKQDSITDEYNKKNETLQAKIDKLVNAFDKYVLGIDASGHVTGTFGAILDFLAQNLGTIINLGGQAVRMWLVYKATIMMVNTYNKLAELGFNGIGKSIMQNIPFTRAYRLAQLQTARATQTMTLATNSANASQKALKTTMMGTPWGLIAVAVTELAFALYDYFGASEQSAEATEKAREEEVKRKEALEEMNRKTEEGAEWVAKETTEFVGLINQLKGTNANSRERLSLIDKINSQYGTTLKNLSDETAFQNQLNLAVQEYINYKRLQYKQQANEGKFTDLLKKQELINERIKKIGVSEDTRKNLIAGDFSLVVDSKTMNALGKGGIFGKTALELEELAGQSRKINKDLEDLTKNTMSNADALGKYSYKSKQATTSTGGYSGSVNTATGSVKEFKTELGAVNDYLQESRQLLQDLEMINQDRQIKKINDDIETIIENAQKKIEEGSGIVLGVQLATPTQNAEGELIDEDKVHQANLEKLISSNTSLNRKIQERANLEKLNLKQRAEFEKQTLSIEVENKILEEQNKLLDEKIKLLAQEGITQKDKDKIEASYTQRQKELDVEIAQMQDDLRIKKIKIDETYADDVIKIDEKITDEKKTENEKLLNDFENTNNKKREMNKKMTDDEIEDMKKRQQAIQEIIKASADYFIKKSEEKIAQLDKEIAKAEENQTALEELAKNGNISAKESLAENQKIIDEANKKKLQEQKKQEKIKLVETALTTYSQKVENGSETPLADTIKDITLLTQFINSIPAFFDGTEDTGSNGRGVDGRGGFHAVLHPNERVIPKSLNQQIGNLSNEQLTKLAVEYQNMKVFTRNDSQIGSAMDTAILVQKLDNLTSVIENKPEHHFEIGQITQTFFEMIEKTKKGNTTIFNKYKVKR
jgi:TP901 family phage tail tape measure protein